VEFRLLRYFLVVANELHVGRAAEKLRMTQQPLSAAIQKLERELGVELFVREANRIRLTTAGAAFVPAARDLLVKAEAARAAARGDVGTLRVGHCSAAMREIVPALVTLYRARHPSVAFDLVQLPQREQLERLALGKLDLAFVYGPLDERNGCSLTVSRDRLVVAMRSDHPLASRSSVSPAEVAALVGAAYSPDEYAEFLAFVAGAFGEHATAARPMTFGRDRTSLLALVAGGAGMAVLTESGAEAEQRPDVAFRALATPLSLELFAVWEEQRAEEPLVRAVRVAIGEVASAAGVVSKASALDALRAERSARQAFSSETFGASRVRGARIERN